MRAFRNAAVGAGVAVGAVVFLIVVTSILGLVLGGESEDDPSRSPRSDRLVDASFVDAGDDPFPALARPLDGVRRGDAVYLEAELHSPVSARLCGDGARVVVGCGPALAVDEPADGTARFLFELIPASDVDCRESPCSIVLFEDGGDVVGSVPVVFGVAQPHPSIDLGVGAPFAAGEEVVVRLDGFRPGQEVVVTQCTPPGPIEARACGAPAPERSVEIGDDGTAMVEFPVHIGRVGSGECRRGRPCGIGVVGGGQLAPVATLTLAGTAGADPPRGRVVGGLAVAVVAAAAGAVLLRRSDWSPIDGDPFAGIELVVPPGWEHLGNIADDDDLAEW